MMFSIRFQRISHSKSDHYGIEIEMISRLTKGIEATELKSDHFGIEIYKNKKSNKFLVSKNNFQQKFKNLIKGGINV